MRRNDEITADEAERLAPSHLVVSPGPGRPEEAGVVRGDRAAPSRPACRCSACASATRRSSRCSAARSAQAQQLVHGKATRRHHDGRGIFAGLPQDFPAGRYHSLAATSMPDVSRGLGDGGRRRGDGRAAPRAADRRRAVPPRVGADARTGRDIAKNFLEDAVIQQALAQLLDGHDLSRDEAREVMNTIMSRRGDAGPDRRLPRGAAAEGRDGGRDRRLRRGHARARAARAADARRPRRHRRHRRRRRQHVQHLDRGRARRRRGRRRRREARQPRGLLGDGRADVLEALGFELDHARRSGSRSRSTSSASASCSRRPTTRR